MHTTIIKPLPSIAESAIPVGLLDDLRSGNVYAFVGSGLSIPVGYPSWGKLISDIYKSIRGGLWNLDLQTEKWLDANFKNRPDWTAEILKSSPGDFYNKALKEIFKKKTNIPVSLIHALLSLIPFKGYLTTNFDPLVEEYLGIFHLENPKVWNYNEILESPGFRNDNKLNVYKIHGCADKDINSLILASNDYYKLTNDERYIRFLDGIFSQNSILTIGFSLTDRDFRQFVEERYNLYRSNCAPMYAIIGSDETCPLETQVYLNKYNIHLVPISKENNYSELSSLMLSIFCLVHQVDSSEIGPEINQLLYSRLYKTGKFAINNDYKSSNDIEAAIQLLSVFQEPIEIDLFATVCTDFELELSSAHFKAIFSTDGNFVFLKQKALPSDEHLEFIAKWLSTYFETIPLGSTSRYLSIYHKKFLSQFSKTIFFLLSKKVGWDFLIGISGESKSQALRLRRINEYYRQEGKWTPWLEVCDHVETFIDKTTPLYIELLKTKVWVYFWTRRFDEAKSLLQLYPEIDEKEGQYSYWSRLQYMKLGALKKLVRELEEEKTLEYFNRSLLGRSYARLSLKAKNNAEKKRYLMKAEENLRIALNDAKKNNDMIETAVQSWYLAVTCADNGKIEESHTYLSQVKRLDESIMNRIPGKAWLRLAEYRIYLKQNKIEETMKFYLKDIAVRAISELGILNAEQYVESEYYY